MNPNAAIDIFEIPQADKSTVYYFRPIGRSSEGEDAGMFPGLIALPPLELDAPDPSAQHENARGLSDEALRALGQKTLEVLKTSSELTFDKTDEEMLKDHTAADDLLEKLSVTSLEGLVQKARYIAVVRWYNLIDLEHSEAYIDGKTAGFHRIGEPVDTLTIPDGKDNPDTKELGEAIIQAFDQCSLGEGLS